MLSVSLYQFMVCFLALVIGDNVWCIFVRSAYRSSFHVPCYGYFWVFWFMLPRSIYSSWIWWINEFESNLLRLRDCESHSTAPLNGCRVSGCVVVNRPKILLAHTHSRTFWLHKQLPWSRSPNCFLFAEVFVQMLPGRIYKSGDADHYQSAALC